MLCRRPIREQAVTTGNDNCVGIRVRTARTCCLKKQICAAIAAEIAHMDAVLIRRPGQSPAAVRYLLGDRGELAVSVGQQHVVPTGRVPLQKQIVALIVVEAADLHRMGAAVPLDAEVIAEPGLIGNIRSRAVGPGDAARPSGIVGDVQQIGFSVPVEIAGIQIVISGAPFRGCICALQCPPADDAQSNGRKKFVLHVERTSSVPSTLHGMRRVHEGRSCCLLLIRHDERTIQPHLPEALRALQRHV